MVFAIIMGCRHQVFSSEQEGGKFGYSLLMPQSFSPSSADVNCYTQERRQGDFSNVQVCDQKADTSVFTQVCIYAGVSSSLSGLYFRKGERFCPIAFGWRGEIREGTVWHGQQGNPTRSPKNTYSL